MASHLSDTPIKDPVSVSVGEMGLGKSADALDLREGRCPPVVHVPRTDIDMAPLDRTTRASTCPWKGKAQRLFNRHAVGCAGKCRLVL